MRLAKRTKAKFGRIPKFNWSKEEGSGEEIRRGKEIGNKPKKEGS